MKHATLILIATFATFALCHGQSPIDLADFLANVYADGDAVHSQGGLESVECRVDNGGTHDDLIATATLEHGLWNVGWFLESRAEELGGLPLVANQLYSRLGPCTFLRGDINEDSRRDSCSNALPE